VDPASGASRLVCWRLDAVDFGGTWGWGNLDGSDLARLHVQLVAIESERFDTLKREKRAKSVKVEQICQEAQERLQVIAREDTEDLWELRISEKKWRAWGFVEGSIFSLLWWDPDHTVCRGLAKGVRRQR
jgi:hypothetical protein